MSCFTLICSLSVVFAPFQRKGENRIICRSLSVSVNNKEKTIRRMDSFFRVIPSTPRVKEKDAVSVASPTVDAGTSDYLNYFLPLTKSRFEF